MMPTKRVKKQLTMMLVALLSITNIQQCHAWTVEIGSLSENTEIPFEKIDSNYKINNKYFLYTYEKRILSNSPININAYNINGESVMPEGPEIDATKYSFKSGTWVGIEITERQYVQWEIKEFKAVERRKKYLCKYKSSTETKTETKSKAPVKASECTCPKCWFSPFGDPANNPDGQCNWKTTYTIIIPGGSYVTDESYDYYAEPNKNPCKSTYNGQEFDSYEETYEDVETTSGDGEYWETLKEKAYEEVYNEAISRIGGSFGTIEFIKSHNYPKDPDDLIYGYIHGGDPINEYSDEPGESGKAYRDYIYTQSKVCMNLKTAEVTYGEDCKKNDSDVKEIKNKKYWHYFIPLNTKNSNNAFFLKIIPNKKLSVNECETAMKKYADRYKDILIPNLGDMFVGDYHKGKKVSSDWNKVDNNGGCYFGTTIYFPTIQRFYNETEDKKIKGFNFYYKPIEINNPFPNGISETSAWKDWYASENKIPNLNESYSTITYKALNINAGIIRHYNNIDESPRDGISDNLYNDWTKMNIDGTSKYIDNNNPIQRNGKINVYKLGCGQANVDEYLSLNKKNPLYQEWCDNS